ncbi:MAG: Trypsin-like peptidase domain [Planctomycetota bacterium]|jgi:S1-C subfamily serine protease
MNRTLVEVVCGVCALGLMVSFHHQIARLEVRQQDVAALERKFGEAMAAKQDEHRLDLLREQILAETTSRIASLQAELHTVSAGSAQAQEIERELDRAKSEVQNFRSEVTTDFARTKALVDAYINEVRAKEKNAALKISETEGAIATLASRIYRDPNERTRSMLMPTVQLNGDDTVGSGTIVFSDINPTSGKQETYALTSYHVVRNILADTPRANREGFDTTIYLQGERLVVKGKMVASKPGIDAALVRLFTDRKLPNVANVMPKNEAPHVEVWDSVCAVGCPLGNDPVPSNGEISSLKNELNGANYWMINAPTYFGNSGGGIYLADTHQLIGVFSKIYTHGKSNPVVVPHMGLCTPIGLVHEWLESEGMSHLLSSSDVERVDLRPLAAPAK